MADSIVYIKCSGCGVEKEISFFPLGKKKCKSCKREYMIEWSKKNAETLKAKKKIYNQNNKEYISNKNKAYRLVNLERLKERNRAWRDENKEILTAKRKQKYEDNRLKYVERSRFNRSNRPEAIKATYYRNIENRLFHTKKRRAKLLNCCPEWDAEFDDFVMKEALSLRRLRNKTIGILWHIDHIEPLQSKTVCGLHNAFNISVVPASYNLTKNNRQIEGHWIRNYESLNQ